MLAAYVATLPGAPVVKGFYTLSTMSITSGLAATPWQRTRAPTIPVLYMRALAVDKSTQGQGLGSALLVDAIRRSIKIADEVGVAAITLDVLQDADTERRTAFYTSLGFKVLGDPANPGRHYLPMAQARLGLA